MRKDDFKNMFTFNKSERRGAFTLSIAILIVLLYLVFKPYFSQQKFDFEAFHKDVAELKSEKRLREIILRDSLLIAKKEEVNSKLPKLFNFDPNTISYKDWLLLGLSPKQARSICKYIRKGGHFYRKEDIKRMYCLNSKECNRLMPYITFDIEEQDEIDDEGFGSDIVQDTIKIELNSAGFEDLLAINGIGPATAKGILKYKSYLGGYVNIEQLNEVYQIDSLRYQQIKGFFVINRDSVKVFDINSATYYELKKHPYISKSLAYKIAQQRSMKGDFKSVEELKNINGISDSIYQKIYLYFAVFDK